jgi:hypothetical protein
MAEERRRRRTVTNGFATLGTQRVRLVDGRRQSLLLPLVSTHVLSGQRGVQLGRPGSEGVTSHLEGGSPAAGWRGGSDRAVCTLRALCSQQKRSKRKTWGALVARTAMDSRASVRAALSWNVAANCLFSRAEAHSRACLRPAVKPSTGGYVRQAHSRSPCDRAPASRNRAGHLPVRPAQPRRIVPDWPSISVTITLSSEAVMGGREVPRPAFPPKVSLPRPRPSGARDVGIQPGASGRPSIRLSRRRRQRVGASR